jgi:hypothetical protein
MTKRTKKIELNKNVPAARYPEGRTEADILPSDPNLTVLVSEDEQQEATPLIKAEVVVE